MNTQQAIMKHTTGGARRLKSYRKLGQRIINPTGQLIYQDNGGAVLFVGHLDTVLWGKPVAANGRISNCPQLDDRLGVAIGLELLGSIVTEPYDVLLTDCEEQGQSTARYFVDPPREYRWVVEFDRAGSDCVFYDYSDGTLQESFEQCGCAVDWGSYSDISALEHLGAQCVNFGCGYHGQHTKSCFCNVAEVESQLAKFGNWYKHFGQAEYPWDGPKYVAPARSSGHWSKSYSRGITTWEDYRKAWVPDRQARLSPDPCPVCGCVANWTNDDYCVDCGRILREMDYRERGTL